MLPSIFWFLLGFCLFLSFLNVLGIEALSKLYEDWEKDMMEQGVLDENKVDLIRTL